MSLGRRELSYFEVAVNNKNLLLNYIEKVFIEFYTGYLL